MGDADAAVQLEQAVAQFQAGQFSDAVETLKAIILSDANNQKARAYLGAAYGQLGQRQEAIDEFLELTRLDAGNASYQFNLGQAYAAAGKNAEAEAALKAALQLKPDYTKAKDALAALAPSVPPATAPPPATPPAQPQAVPPPWGQTNQQAGQPVGGSSYAQTSQRPPIARQPAAKTPMESWIIVLALIVFFPAGLYLMWNHSDWGSKAKTAVTLVFTAVLVIAVMGPTIGPITPKGKAEQKVMEMANRMEKCNRFPNLCVAVHLTRTKTDSDGTVEYTGVMEYADGKKLSCTVQAGENSFGYSATGMPPEGIRP